MKRFIFFFLLSCFTISGCAFLSGKDNLTLEDSYEDEETGEEEFNLEEEEDDEDEDKEDEEFVVDDEDGEFVDEDEDGEFVEEDEEEKKSGGLSGFFSRLFGFSDDDEDDGEFIGEDGDFAEGDYEDYEEEEDKDYSAVSEDPILPAPEESPESAVAPVSNGKTEIFPKKSQSKFIPLRKIINVPYRKANYLVNAVYIARPGDTLKSISQKIYGSDQVADLYTINPHLKSRSVKVGDKIYYNSPYRKNDKARLLFYYQDINAPSTFYTLSQGDNIRKVAGQLLGHPNSWKEIWATNPGLKSKGEIEESISIVYWPKTVAGAKLPESVVEKKVPPEDESGDPNQKIEPIQEETPPLEEPFPPVPPVTDPGDQTEPEKDKTAGILPMIFKQKEIMITLFGILIILILIIRLIVKKRKQRNFDYTATNIEV